MYLVCNVVFSILIFVHNQNNSIIEAIQRACITKTKTYLWIVDMFFSDLEKKNDNRSIIYEMYLDRNSSLFRGY